MFKKVLWFLSGFCTVLFFVPAFTYAWVILLISALLLLWLSYADDAGKRLGFSRRVLPNVLGLLLLGGCGLIFYCRWMDRFDPPVTLALTIGVCILSSYFVLTTVAKIFMRSWAKMLPAPKKKHSLSLRSRLFILLCVGVLLFLCSACSLLYPVNPTMSANTLMTGGRSMLSGMHLYEELYGTAGPVPYLFNALSWTVFQNFTGVFILELILDGLFFIYMIKMVSLYYDGNRLVLAFPIMAAVFSISPAFGNGDTSEEFCLLFLAVCFYISMKAFKENRIPGYISFFIAGLCIGFVTWTQYSVLGFFAGWLLIQWFLMMLKKRWKKLFWGSFLIALGAAAASAPILYYFYTTSTLASFFQSYFLESFVWSASEGGYLFNMIRMFANGILRSVEANPLLFLQTVLSFICALRLGYRLFFQLLVCFVGMVIFQNAFFVWTPDSALVWNAFGAFSLILYYQFYQSLELTYFRQMPIRVLGLLIALIAGYYGSGTMAFSDHKASDFAQVQAAQTIDQVSEAKLLCYNMPDRGFYTYSNLLPVTKYYAGAYDEDSEYEKAQRKLIEERKVDFIISMNRLSPELTRKGKYSLIKSMNAFTPDKQAYYLYTRSKYTSLLSY